MGAVPSVIRDQAQLVASFAITASVSYQSLITVIAASANGDAPLNTHLAGDYSAVKLDTSGSEGLGGSPAPGPLLINQGEKEFPDMDSSHGTIFLSLSIIL